MTWFTLQFFRVVAKKIPLLRETKKFKFWWTAFP